VQHADKGRGGSQKFTETGIRYYAGENNPTQAAQPSAFFDGHQPDCQADDEDGDSAGNDAVKAYRSPFLACGDGAPWAQAEASAGLVLALIG